MKQTKVFCHQDVPIFEDKKGNTYSHADMTFESVFKAIDDELKKHDLELLIGDYESSDFFFSIVKQKGKIND
jgi:hypothetical protein